MTLHCYKVLSEFIQHFFSFRAYRQNDTHAHATTNISSSVEIIILIITNTGTNLALGGGLIKLLNTVYDT